MIIVNLQGATKSFVASQRPPRAARLVSAAMASDSRSFDRQPCFNTRMHLSRHIA